MSWWLDREAAIEQCHARRYPHKHMSDKQLDLLYYGDDYEEIPNDRLMDDCPPNSCDNHPLVEHQEHKGVK